MKVVKKVLGSVAATAMLIAASVAGAAPADAAYYGIPQVHNVPWSERVMNFKVYGGGYYNLGIGYTRYFQPHYVWNRLGYAGKCWNANTGVTFVSWSAGEGWVYLPAATRYSGARVACEEHN
ncbi:MAG: hypothetical protein K0S68_581 [Candidatus Saccharibacteria bacterium]|nr:hypothetical protein [Candidatus Saccharibacteria bacterium]